MAEYKVSLEAARVNVGILQSGAAKRVGVSRGTIINWENGNSMPPADKLWELSRLYGVPVDLIFLGKKSALSELLCPDAS